MEPDLAIIINNMGEFKTIFAQFQAVGITFDFMKTFTDTLTSRLISRALEKSPIVIAYNSRRDILQWIDPLDYDYPGELASMRYISIHSNLDIKEFSQGYSIIKLEDGRPDYRPIQYNNIPQSITLV